MLTLLPKTYPNQDCGQGWTTQPKKKTRTAQQFTVLLSGICRQQQRCNKCKMDISWRPWTVLCDLKSDVQACCSLVVSGSCLLVTLPKMIPLSFRRLMESQRGKDGCLVLRSWAAYERIANGDTRQPHLLRTICCQCIWSNKKLPQKKACQ